MKITYVLKINKNTCDFNFPDSLSPVSQFHRSHLHHWITEAASMGPPTPGWIPSFNPSCPPSFHPSDPPPGHPALHPRFPPRFGSQGEREYPPRVDHYLPDCDQRAVCYKEEKQHNNFLADNNADERCDKTRCTDNTGSALIGTHRASQHAADGKEVQRMHHHTTDLSRALKTSQLTEISPGTPRNGVREGGHREAMVTSRYRSEDITGRHLRQSAEGIRSGSHGGASGFLQQHALLRNSNFARLRPKLASSSGELFNQEIHVNPYPHIWVKSEQLPI